jgi:biopolymer transport protein ExbD
MTDIVFLLLIFFILVSTIVKDPALKLVLPKGKPQVETTPQTIVIGIDQDLQYSVNNIKTTIDRLPITLSGVLKENEASTVSVAADQSIEYGKVMEAVLIADKLGAKVVLALKKVK